jgi:predicted ATPase
MIRMLVESGDGSADRVPDTLQALIAARIDNLSAESKSVLQRAAVIGRVFWRGAVEHLTSANGTLDALLDDLLQRELILRESRSSITGEKAYRFKHVLIREVAYSGLSKEARAQLHAAFAVWLKENAGDELIEIRAHHLDQAAHLLAELDGAAPAELAAEAAAALTAAGKRAIAREAYRSARKLLVRAVELEPTLRRRYSAARAAWRLGDLAAVSVEMEKVRAEAEAENDLLTQALALTALGDATMRQSGDVTRAQELVDKALQLQGDKTDPDAHFDALVVRGPSAGAAATEASIPEQAFADALAGRKDLERSAEDSPKATSSASSSTTQSAARQGTGA